MISLTTGFIALSTLFLRLIVLGLAAAASESPNECPATEAATVAIIGCGPSGMFFLHAVETKRRMLQEKGDMETLAKLPKVTCFERSSHTGGLWRPAETNNSTTTNMYDALWTNGPKEFIEFFDYTFDQHFQKPLPIYMPREAILDYILTRVTRHNPHIFDAVQFESTVEYVTYDSSSSQFEMIVRDNTSNQNSTHFFDKVIWGAGLNGQPKMPRSITHVLQKANFQSPFQGQVVHSSAIGSILSNIQDQTLVMFGDAFSAEDLALQAIKRGAKKIYLISRSGRGICNSVGSWPGNKVEILNGYALSDVIQEGHGLRFQKATMNFEVGQQYFDEGGTSEKVDQIEIQNVMGIILCTGYEMNMNMLDPQLRKMHDEYNEEAYTNLSPDWKMEPNEWDDVMGDIPPHSWLDSEWAGVTPGMYHGLSIDNPNMMYLFDHANMPLLGIDIHAWELLAFIIGEAPIPSKDEMIAYNDAIVEEAMQYPVVRASLDISYLQASIEKEAWRDEETVEMLMEDSYTFSMQRLAADMRIGNYPFSIGTADELNEAGHKYVEMLTQAEYDRDVDPDSEDSEWETFRDADPSNYASVHTNTAACKLKQHWLDISDDISSVL